MDLSHITRAGVFSAAWARAAGLDSDAVARLVRQGRAHPLVRGWYAVEEPKDEVDWQRQASRAAYLRLGGRAMVSHHSCLVWQGLPAHQTDLSTVHLTRVGDGSSRSRPGIRLHRSVAGVPVSDRVPTAVAVVQAGLETGPLTSLVAADAALHRRMVTRDDLTAAVGLLARSRGIGPVRAVLAEADARIESPGETLLGHLLRQHGWSVTPQLEVRTDLGTRFVDFLIDGTRVVVEFDGQLKYRGEEGGDVVFLEKRREDALRRAGWIIVRFVWAELFRPHVVRARIVAALAEAAA